MPLSERVYCVAVTFKIIEQGEQWICIKFSLSLNIPLWKLVRWFRRPQRWATGDWQLHHHNVPTHAACLVQSFWQNIKSPRCLSPHTAQIWCPVISGLTQNQNHLWKERNFTPLMRFRKIQLGNCIWQLGEWQLGEMCRSLLWRGPRCHCPMYNVSSILYLLQ